ncbi:uncharacterized protein LOC106151052 [Lingula anatina]|uniref:Uncharacterized protein LOC106151052 n=1 Tax=Lingula anatina TaxID=7574 RepID=A0A1S3H377_LINAN|nr:uncharacterized protein LOC106151052 [Lingula anatina]|eukprot:XP_013379584.1 uncharacterized protein LOC106151052 [Lingula anatina]
MHRKKIDQMTGASLRNVRHQQRLVSQWDSLDQQRDKELKNFTKKRLECTYDLTYYRNNKQGLEHLSPDLKGEGLKKLTDDSRSKWQADKKNRLDKYSLKQPDPVDRMPIPQISNPTEIQAGFDKFVKESKEMPTNEYDANDSYGKFETKGADDDENDDCYLLPPVMAFPRRWSTTVETITELPSQMPLQMSRIRRNSAMAATLQTKDKFSRPCDILHMRKHLPPVNLPGQKRD